MESFVTRFFKMESAAGIILMLAAVLALILTNTPLSTFYELIISTPVEVKVGQLEIAKPLLLWINDGLMAVFFFLVGLELKRELVEGELADKRNIILPAAGAFGGMLVPALIYVAFNYADEFAMQGWAIPAATDIAFALGILTLLGSRVPITVKIFLTSLAIFDDIGAIVIIAIFYTEKISIEALIIVSCVIPLLFMLNRRTVESKTFYLLLGLIMWIAMLKSGVHATLAGIILAMFIPLKSNNNPNSSPLKEMEHDLHFTVAFFILPVFAFTNAGINLSDVGIEQLLHPVPVGIAVGLFIGKMVGVFSCCWLVVKSGLSKLPNGINWPILFATAVLCGVGFTMSLFIGSLAFEDSVAQQIFDQRIGIIIGSVISGVVGYFLLWLSLPKK